MTTVAFHFDFVSPYSHLALVQARRFEEQTGARFELRPVCYAKILEATGLVGPAEVEAKRRYTFSDILRCAHRIGVPLVPPAEHPFRSLEALRTILVHRQDPRVLDLAVALSSACWAHGCDLTDEDMITRVVARAGFDTTDLAGRIAAPEIKDELAASTAQALCDGVFGVPTFLVGREMFWGHDRMPYLADFLAGRLPSARDLAAPLAERRREEC